ncbi:hypothetical protein ABPG72_014407 [Tetrahymena utriculariae]
MKYQLLEDFLKADLSIIQEAQLIFNDSFINDQKAAFLGVKLQYCKDLEKLSINLNGNNFGSYGISHIATGIGKCINVNISGFSLIQINKCFISWKKFCVMYKFGISLYQPRKQFNDFNDRSNQIGDIGAHNIVKNLNRCKYLQSVELYLAINQIGDKGASQFGEELGKCENIKKLNLSLSGNNIYEEGASELAKGLAKIKSLNYFKPDFYGNIINEKGGYDLGVSLKTITNLQILHLNLSSNQIKSRGASGLGQGIQNCQHLTDLRLYLDSYEIGQKGVADLIKGIELSRNIKNIILDLKNSITVQDQLKSQQTLNCLKQSLMKSKRLVLYKIKNKNFI